MRKFIAIAALALCSPALSRADNVVTMTVTITTAQQDAESMARTGILRHCGRNGGTVEGIGFSAVSGGHAIKNSCFWGQRKVREIGVARGSRGWFACVRYY
jgi:hypothetical protein